MEERRRGERKRGEEGRGEEGRGGGEVGKKGGEGRRIWGRQEKEGMYTVNWFTILNWG